MQDKPQKVRAEVIHALAVVELGHADLLRLLPHDDTASDDILDQVHLSAINPLAHISGTGWLLRSGNALFNICCRLLVLLNKMPGQVNVTLLRSQQQSLCSMCQCAAEHVLHEGGKQSSAYYTLQALAEVTEHINPDAHSKGRYRLLKHAWTEFDPQFPHYTRRDRDQALHNAKNAKWEPESQLLPPLHQLPRALRGVLRLLDNPLLHRWASLSLAMPLLLQFFSNSGMDQCNSEPEEALHKLCYNFHTGNRGSKTMLMLQYGLLSNSSHQRFCQGLSPPSPNGVQCTIMKHPVLT